MAVTCEILGTLIEFPETSTGWHKELSLVKWGDNPPKYDFRSWNDDRSKMGKGLTLTKDELALLQVEIQKIKF